jgi:hypothetical protein
MKRGFTTERLKDRLKSAGGGIAEYSVVLFVKSEPGEGAVFIIRLPVADRVDSAVQEAVLT